ncbi:MAG: endonuclease MutS2 [Clostridiales bacterium]|nr:endonuclease MutS2 [Clostridiales bacterium]
MNQKAIEKTELNKILSLVSDFAVLDGGKNKILERLPSSKIGEVKRRLSLTEEAIELLFHYGVSKIERFEPFTDELQRAKKGSTLSCAELLSLANLLRSTRIAHTSISGVNDENLRLLKALADNLYFDKNLEEDITTKILNDSEVSDYASDKLYSLRKEIRTLNERIRTRLSEYLTGSEGKYLQDNIVTMRDNRYVLPVRAEYKRNIKGFIHDRSASGATFFIEPEEVLEMNNELRSLTIDEKEEVERILGELTRRVGFMGDELERDKEILEELDGIYACAEYGYKLSCVRPEVNDKGVVAFEQGRHPLIDRKKVVPVTLSLGKNYRFLLISGPNTGGKTVTLKMVGLFSLMAMCGLFIPAKRADVSVFDEIYCDVGDAQSIEESLSTFSSHITNIINIVDNVTEKCLVLVDELGGGTDPEEGQALAKAVVSHLLKTGCTGVVTTHYTAMKEFAFAEDGIENACMEFDADTLQPLYVIKIGIPGSSNALAISKRLGLKESILKNALLNMSEGAQNFENIVRNAEESRIKADEELRKANAIKSEWQEKMRQLDEEKKKLEKDKEKLFVSAKAESRRIINERTAQAEEWLLEIENIFAQEEISQADLIKARTLKNKIANQAYQTDDDGVSSARYADAKEKDIQVGAKVFVKNINQEGVVQVVRKDKKEVEVLCGNMKIRSKISDLSVILYEEKKKEEKLPKWKKRLQQKSETVSVSKNLAVRPMPSLEINVIGQTVQEALPQVEAFIDGAVVGNLEEVRIVHGVGTGKLRAGIHEFLRKHRNVAEFRLGRYGEGETGVTIVKIK